MAAEEFGVDISIALVFCLLLVGQFWAFGAELWVGLLILVSSISVVMIQYEASTSFVLYSQYEVTNSDRLVHLQVSNFNKVTGNISVNSLLMTSILFFFCLDIELIGLLPVLLFHLKYQLLRHTMIFHWWKTTNRFWSRYHRNCCYFSPPL
mgnify:FL=1